MKKLYLCLSILVCLVGLTSCKKVKFDPNSKTLRVGLECAYAPFNWAETKKTDSNVPIHGQSNLYAEGYDIQIAKLIAADLGYDLVIEMIDWDGLVPALESGKIDLIIAGMSPTEPRKQRINFTDEYYHSNHVILVKKDGAYQNATTFADLDGAKVMGQDLTLYDDLAKQISEKNTNALYQNPLASVPEIIYAMNAGTVDVTVLEEPVAQGIVASYPQYKYIQLTTPFDVEEEDVKVSIGIRKIDTTLLSQINEALSKISQETRNQLMKTAVENQEG